MILSRNVIFSGFLQNNSSENVPKIHRRKLLLEWFLENWQAYNKCNLIRMFFSKFFQCFLIEGLQVTVICFKTSKHMAALVRNGLRQKDIFQKKSRQFFSKYFYPLSKWNFFHQSNPFSTCILRIYHVKEQCSCFGKKNNICYLSDNLLKITDYKILHHQKL